MESLFVRQTPKRGRVCMMLGASLLLHSGIVGIAALWTQPEPPVRSVTLDLWPNDGDYVHSSLPPTAPPETPEPTSSPDVVDKPDPTPPEPTGSPDFAEPATPPPPPHRVTSSKPVAAAPTTNTHTSSHAMPGLVTGDMPGEPGAGPANVAGAWVMPHPPYPHSTLAIRPTGSTTVRIITDASGRVSNVVIVKSAGNPLLDNQTQSFVRMNWHGPPNASRTTEFVYQIR